MNLRHVWTVFRKDGQELLRDRRTIFVNVVLPVLLYPLMAMFLLQVYQLTAAAKPPPPRVALVGVDERVSALLATGKDKTPVELVTLSPEMSAELARLAADVQAAQDESNDAEGVADRRRATRAALLARMRADDARLVYVVADHSSEEERAAGLRALTVADDDAHPDHDYAQEAMAHALGSYAKELREAAADRAGLDRKSLDPVKRTLVSLAPGAQAVRSKLAGIIPLLLVMMAVAGAFHPALDLIAGERERGTLETLLSWPVSRRDLFLGKLLVTIVAGVVAVVLNLLSFGVTAALAGSQFASAAGGGELRELLSVGGGALALSFLALLPLIVTVSAISLALAGFAASSKEAQNYLSPLFLVVFMAAVVAQVPNARPTLALDLVPITGPVLALKECLRATELPWLHLILSTASSVALAAVVVSWSVRLLDQESFCYPGLVRAGWGRFRRWGAAPAAPGGLEAIALYAICAAGFLYGGAHLARFGPVTEVVGPLLCCIAFPMLLHAWLGGYRPEGLHLTRPKGRDVVRGLLIAPLAITLSLAIAALQPSPPAGESAGGERMQYIFGVIEAQGGLPLLLLCIAVAPGICEELLCRGTLLAGLRRGLGPVGAVLISAFLFAVLHLTPYRFLPQFAVGVALAVLTLRSGSLVPAMLVHALHNGGAVLLSVWLGDTVAEDGLLTTPQAILAAALATIGIAAALRSRAGDCLPRASG